ncbi:FAD-dependent monooxygenase [Amycolatopsis sp. La24]|uniref:FAD-dependent oxidoreductase n=1 Tax=Amycolatopsis sp. La24 TaxID=3028304 RepID=UPI0023B0AB13|nr:FAD-dependent monooxygenase [Amycolatopsis sp. La24]
MNAHEPARTEVLVVGAGPAGMAAAASLSDQGVETMVVDKQAEMMNTSRAAVVHARTLEVLEEIGVTEELVARGIRVSKFTVREHDRVLLHIDFDQLPSEVTALAQDPAGVTVTLATGEQIRAGYVIGADGMHSLVREQAGITFHGDSYPQSFVLADVVLTGDVTDAEVRLYFAPEGVTVLAPLPGGRHRIVATVDDAPPHPDRSQVQALLDTRGPRTGSIDVTDLGWSSRFRVHHRLADRYRAGRVFLAGDAAHVHSPAGGQGMNTGIQDALDLARRLGAVLRDGAPDSTLDGYEAERRPVAEEIVAFTDKMTRAATLGSPALRAIRNTAMRTLDWLPAVHRKMALTLSELKTGH